MNWLRRVQRLSKIIETFITEIFKGKQSKSFCSSITDAPRLATDSWRQCSSFIGHRRAWVSWWFASFQVSCYSTEKMEKVSLYVELLVCRRLSLNVSQVWCKPSRRNKSVSQTWTCSGPHPGAHWSALPVLRPQGSVSEWLLAGNSQTDCQELKSLSTEERSPSPSFIPTLNAEPWMLGRRGACNSDTSVNQVWRSPICRILCIAEHLFF